MPHLVQILLPLHDNTGMLNAEAAFEHVIGELTRHFGGVTAYTRTPAEADGCCRAGTRCVRRAGRSAGRDRRRGRRYASARGRGAQARQHGLEVGVEIGVLGIGLPILVGLVPRGTSAFPPAIGVPAASVSVGELPPIEPAAIDPSNVVFCRPNARL